jgi:hypothetical protein
MNSTRETRAFPSELFDASDAEISFRRDDCKTLGYSRRREHIQHGTGRRRLPGTPLQGVGENALELKKIGDHGANLIQMGRRQFLHFGAGCPAWFGKNEVLLDLVDAETDSTRAADEGKPLDVPLANRIVKGRRKAHQENLASR